MCIFEKGFLKVNCSFNSVFCPIGFVVYSIETLPVGLIAALETTSGFSVKDGLKLGLFQPIPGSSNLQRAEG